MSDTEKTDQKGHVLSSEMIVDHLRGNPDFFIIYPELLTEIQVPHQSGEAVSLIEKQVSMLRIQNEQIRRQLHELIEIARQNEELARRMHQLILTLIDAADPKEIFNTLYDNLKKNFKVDYVAVRLFATPAFIDSHAGVEFAGVEAPEQVLFSSIIEKRLPFSGLLKRQQLVFLFGDEGDELASAVMIPLHGAEWEGILAIGSKYSNRFAEGMGLELLANLGEMLSLIIKPWVAEGK